MPTAPNPATIFCPKCRYNLTGLTRDVCPECGEAFDGEALRRQVRFEPFRNINPLILFIAPALALVAPALIMIAPEGTGLATVIVLFLAILYSGLHVSFHLTLAVRLAFGVKSESAKSAVAVVVLILDMLAVLAAFLVGAWLAALVSSRL